MSSGGRPSSSSGLLAPAPHQGYPPHPHHRDQLIQSQLERDRERERDRDRTYSRPSTASSASSHRSHPGLHGHAQGPYPHSRPESQHGHGHGRQHHQQPQQQQREGYASPEYRGERERERVKKEEGDVEGEQEVYTQTQNGLGGGSSPKSPRSPHQLSSAPPTHRRSVSSSSSSTSPTPTRSPGAARSTAPTAVNGGDSGMNGHREGLNGNGKRPSSSSSSMGRHRDVEERERGSRSPRSAHSNGTGNGHFAYPPHPQHAPISPSHPSHPSNHPSSLNHPHHPQHSQGQHPGQHQQQQQGQQQQHPESRRRNAEQRAAQLKSDALIGQVEPNRVFCTLCQKWVQLRQDSSFCAYPWIQHRGKCLARHQRRAQKAALQADRRAKRLHGAGYPGHAGGYGVNGNGGEVDELMSDVDDEQDADGDMDLNEEDLRAAAGVGGREEMLDGEDRGVGGEGDRHRTKRMRTDMGPGRAVANGKQVSRHPVGVPSNGMLGAPISISANDGMVLDDVDAEGEDDVDAEGESFNEDQDQVQVIRSFSPRSYPPPPSSNGHAHSRLPPPPQQPQQHRPQSSHGQYVYSQPRRPKTMNGAGARRGPYPPPHHHAPVLADLDSTAGRRAFIFFSIEHLFSTTYENVDDMTISALLTYLNAAMPPDKHEDFDTSEVIKAVVAFKDKGRVVFEGDVLRLV
ncbi:hypothetical protein ONZ45_g11999 [Pleurotus djamor]|nr:hypothetical protein ONZ45_g11999 [Pleurotus djamor]